VLPRTRAALAAAVVIVVAGSSVNAVTAAPPGRATRRTVAPLPALDAAIAAGINRVRVRHGLTKLRSCLSLRRAAAFHSNDMARGGFFSHDSSDGTPPGTRLARFYPSAHGYRVGETLLWQDGDVDAATAVHDWLASPEHRAILLDPGFRDLGVSAVHATAASGEITLVTADFGARWR